MLHLRSKSDMPCRVSFALMRWLQSIKNINTMCRLEKDAAKLMVKR